VWLAPLQVLVIPVADRHLEYASKLESELRTGGVRVAVDARSQTVNLKIRQGQLDKIPYMLVVGDREVASSTVSVRLRTGEQLPLQSVDSFKKTLTQSIASKTKELK
jgi:threonyl-tRNA synthetase